MPNLNVSVIGSLGYSKDLGKKSTETDITFYDLKKENTTVTIIEPSKYPEKLASLFYAVSFSDYAILIIENLDATFGEILIMLDTIGPKQGSIILRNYISIEQIKKFIKNTVVEKYEFMNDNPLTIRSKLIDLAEMPKNMVTLNYGTIVVDHSFNVRGIGPVVLGVVKDGTIKIHDSLKMLPDMKKVEVRSIQKHDDNFLSAESGDRVGVALKGAEVEELERGVVLSNDNSLKISGIIEVTSTLNPYWQTPIKEGMVINVGHYMQFQMGKIIKYEQTENPLKPKLVIKLNKPITHISGNKAALMYLDGGKLRVMGSIIIP
ncbi:elongation factor Tu [Candidatus Bathyarchaeota archaeon]|nr:elongation factor Tu [Candidatus Bathyarchaeota archaeon]